MRTRVGRRPSAGLQERPGKTSLPHPDSDFRGPAGLRENDRLTSELPRLGAWLPGGGGGHGKVDRCFTPRNKAEAKSRQRTAR